MSRIESGEVLSAGTLVQVGEMKPKEKPSLSAFVLELIAKATPEQEAEAKSYRWGWIAYAKKHHKGEFQESRSVET